MIKSEILRIIRLLEKDNCGWKFLSFIDFPCMSTSFWKSWLVCFLPQISRVKIKWELSNEWYIICKRCFGKWCLILESTPKLQLSFFNLIRCSVQSKSSYSTTPMYLIWDDCWSFYATDANLRMFSNFFVSRFKYHKLCFTEI